MEKKAEKEHKKEAQLSTSKALLHGGDIVSASQHYGIPIDDWIDLSTGINPVAYPVDISHTSFQQLPYIRPEFTQASSDYYGSSTHIPIAGTQAAIQHLPTLLADLPVLIPQVGYQEHRQYWQANNRKIVEYPSINQQDAIEFIDQALVDDSYQHLVIINPNNPTGVLFSPTQLLTWAQQLGPAAYLIVDEAFIDVTPECSVLSNHLPSNIIVLRSFGKFFGLAGIRLGYCFANKHILENLQNKIGIWQVNGPAQAIATQALQDKIWHSHAISRIKIMAAATENAFSPLMTKLKAEPLHDACFQKKPTLYLSYILPHLLASTVCQQFSRRGVLLRVIPLDEKNSLLRIGLLASLNVGLTNKIADIFLLYG